MEFNHHVEWIAFVIATLVMEETMTQQTTLVAVSAWKTLRYKILVLLASGVVRAL